MELILVPSWGSISKNYHKVWQRKITWECMLHGAFFFVGFRRVIHEDGFLFFFRILEKTIGSYLCPPQVLCSEQPWIPGLDRRTQNGKGGWALDGISTPESPVGSGYRSPPLTSPEIALCLALFPFLSCFPPCLTVLPCKCCLDKSLAHQPCLRVGFCTWPKIVNCEHSMLLDATYYGDSGAQS